MSRRKNQSINIVISYSYLGADGKQVLGYCRSIGEMENLPIGVQRELARGLGY